MELTGMGPFQKIQKTTVKTSMFQEYHIPLLMMTCKFLGKIPTHLEAVCPMV